MAHKVAGCLRVWGTRLAHWLIACSVHHDSAWTRCRGAGFHYCDGSVRRSVDDFGSNCRHPHCVVRSRFREVQSVSLTRSRGGFKVLTGGLDGRRHSLVSCLGRSTGRISCQTLRDCRNAIVVLRTNWIPRFLRCRRRVLRSNPGRLQVLPKAPWVLDLVTRIPQTRAPQPFRIGMRSHRSRRLTPAVPELHCQDLVIMT